MMLLLSRTSHVDQRSRCHAATRSHLAPTYAPGDLSAATSSSSSSNHRASATNRPFPNSRHVNPIPPPQHAHPHSFASLQVWETASNSLHTSRPADLADPVSALTWENAPRPVRTGKRQKKVSPVADSVQLILGTNAGQVVLFDLMSGESIAMAKGGHSGRVNDATWGADGATAFTCGDDKQICKWDLGSKTQVQKWKGGSQPVTALTYLVQVKGNDLLISGGLKIKIWDAEDMVELTSLRGHAFSISSLESSGSGHVLSCRKVGGGATDRAGRGQTVKGGGICQTIGPTSGIIIGFVKRKRSRKTATRKGRCNYESCLPTPAGWVGCRSG